MVNEELTDSNSKTRNETKLYVIAGRPKEQWRADNKVDVFNSYCCFKRYSSAKKWIEKNKEENIDCIIIERVAWVLAKDLNYLLGKNKNYWRC